MIFYYVNLQIHADKQFYLAKQTVETAPMFGSSVWTSSANTDMCLSIGNIKLLASQSNRHHSPDLNKANCVGTSSIVQLVTIATAILIWQAL